MAYEDGKRRGGRSLSGRGNFDGRDLLVGRPERAADSGAPDAPDPEAETIAHLLATLRRMQARLDVLQAGPEASEAAALALASAREQLNQSVQDARGALAAAAAPGAKRKHDEAVSAKLLIDGARALEDQAAGIEKRLEKAREQERAVTGVVETMRDTAGRIDAGLGLLEREVERRAAVRRRRGWAAGAVLASTAAAALVAGAVVQRETGVLTLGDPRHAWNAYVAAHYAPLLASCAGKAVVDHRSVNCRIVVTPPRAVTVPVYPRGGLAPAPPAEEFDPAAGE